MAEVLERVYAEIRERLEVSRAAVQEYERLEAALSALGPFEQHARSTPAGAGRRSRAARSASRRSRRSTGSRAPRGANREAVLRVLGERPGVSASELAGASGVDRSVLYGLLGRLVQRGEVTKEALPDGSHGYSLPRQGAPPAPARGPQAEAEAEGESPPEAAAQDASAPAEPSQ